MCRSCTQGGRRCPGETARKRRARQNAAYHARKNATSPRSPQSGGDDPSASAGLPPLGEGATSEDVRERVRNAREVVDAAGADGAPWTAQGSAGWLAPTEAGIRAEAATRAAGAAVAARAEVLAAPEVQRVGMDERVRSFVPGGAASRQEYAAHVKAQGDRLVQEIHGLRKQAGVASSHEETMALRDQANGMVNEANRFLVEDAHVEQGDCAWDRAEAVAYSQAYRQALSEQRSMGLPDGRMIAVDSESQKATVGRLKTGLAYYPSDWLARDGDHESRWRSEDFTEHQERIPLRVRSTKKRAHYAPVVIHRRYTRDEVQVSAYSELTIDKRDRGCLGPGISTAIHEYGHRAERVQPRVNELAQVQLARRTTNGDGSRHSLEPYLVGKQRARGGPSSTLWEYMQRDEGKSEWVRSDDFVTRYAGKQNSSDEESSELFTTGMEGVFAGRFGGLRGMGRWAEDREHRDFILGVLAVVK